MCTVEAAQPPGDGPEWSNKRVTEPPSIPLPSGGTRIQAPTLPAPPAPHPFPLMATIAPVVVSVAMWLITESVFALLFAALGPAVAVAGIADSRLHARRRTRRERHRFARELAAAGRAVSAAHATERRRLIEISYGARRVIERLPHDPERWVAGRGSASVTLGWGTQPSTHSVDLAAVSAHDSSPEADAVRELSARAALLIDAPVRIPVIVGTSDPGRVGAVGTSRDTTVGIVGAKVAAGAVARSIQLQLAALLSPSEWRIESLAPPGWMALLPHAIEPGTGTCPNALEEVVFARKRQESPATVRIVAVTRHEDLPTGITTIIAVGPGTLATLDGNAVVTPEFVSHEQATVAAAWLAGQAAAAGLVGETGLPRVVAYSGVPRDLPPIVQDDPTARAHLECVFAMGAIGPLRLDLVSDGPHAVVGGTTGSGKSELLIGWVLALAERYPPRLLTVLLVDFKGGSSFAALAGLPHCVGMISDLDDAAALRALASLRAEVRHRERRLAESHARSIEDAPFASPFPRLVIVVDEFAAMVAEFPELHALFADISARGRSLGLHLILCTQRPAVAVRDAVLANTGIRVSLRVNNRADSIAVVGTDAAASLGSSPPGRAILGVAGDEPIEVQVPLADDADAEGVAGLWRDDPYVPRRPWTDPLPAFVALERLEAEDVEAGDSGRLAFALADVPEEQSQPTVYYTPSKDGNLLVVGGSRSGKTSVLHSLRHTVAASASRAGGGHGDPSVVMPVSTEAVWDAIALCVREISARERRGPRLVLLDDLDAVMTRLGDDHQQPFVDRLAFVLREGPARGIVIVIALQRLVPAISPLLGLCGSRLILRLPNRQEHILAGGASSQFDSGLPPGGGLWKDRRIQVAVPGEHRPAGSEPAGSEKAQLAQVAPLVPITRVPLSAGDLVIVSSRPSDIRLLVGDDARVIIVEVLAGGPAPEPGGQRRVLLGDVDSWQSHWGAVATLARTTPVVFLGCTVAEFRALTRSRATPPPLVESSGAGWLWHGDATADPIAVRVTVSLD